MHNSYNFRCHELCHDELDLVILANFEAHRRKEAFADVYDGISKETTVRVRTGAVSSNVKDLGITPSGLENEHQRYLYEHIAPMCTSALAASLTCPRPICKPPVKKICTRYWKVDLKKTYAKVSDVKSIWC